MSLTRFPRKPVVAVVVALLAQFVILPTDAVAQWRPNPPDQTSNKEVLTYVGVAALITGGVIAYRKVSRKQQQGPTSDDLLSMLVPPPTGRSPEKVDLGASSNPDQHQRPLARLRQPRMLVGWDPERDAPSMSLRWSF